MTPRLDVVLQQINSTKKYKILLGLIQATFQSAITLETVFKTTLIKGLKSMS